MAGRADDARSASGLPWATAMSPKFDGFRLIALRHEVVQL
jgi:hypothetical protein